MRGVAAPPKSRTRPLQRTLDDRFSNSSAALYIVDRRPETGSVLCNPSVESLEYDATRGISSCIDDEIMTFGTSVFVFLHADPTTIEVQDGGLSITNLSSLRGRDARCADVDADDRIINDHEAGAGRQNS